MKHRAFLVGLIALTLPFSVTAGKDNVFAGSWATSPPIALPAFGYEGACMGSVDEFFVMTHGYRSGFGDSGDVNIYDTKTNTWATGTSSMNDRSEGVGASYGGFVYCIGGRVQTLVERYDFAGDSWSTMTPMGIARGGPAAAVFEFHTGVYVGDMEIVDPKIYVFGGRDGSSPFSGDVLDSAEVYDINTDTWSPITPPPTPVADARAVKKGGLIFLIGGATGAPQQPTDELQIYNPYTDSWEAGPPMFSARANLAAAAIGNTIYVMGGFDTLSTTLLTAEAYDVDKGMWSDWITDKPNPSSETHAVRVANKIYVFGSGAFGAAENYFDVFSRK